MTRPTVNDIAREAGVSLATVDRVLNARPGVRAKTVSAVQDAVLRLGYVRDIAAANLARQRRYRMIAAIPESDSQFITTLVHALTDAAQTAAITRQSWSFCVILLKIRISLARPWRNFLRPRWRGWR